MALTSAGVLEPESKGRLGPRIFADGNQLYGDNFDLSDFLRIVVDFDGKKKLGLGFHFFLEADLRKIWSCVRGLLEVWATLEN